MRKLAGLLSLIALLGMAGSATLARASGSSPQFSFSTDESGATFTCALDGGTASACTSPKSYNNLSAGKQTVTITSAFTVPSAGSATTLVGDTAVEGTSDSNPSDQAQAWPYTASASGTAGAISFYVDTGNTAPALRLGLYSNSNGSPGTLLDSGTVSSPHSGAWNTATLSGGVAITSGTKYWLAALGTGGGTFTFRDRAGGTGCTTLVSSQTNLAALSTSFSPGESWQGYCPGSFYINGTNTGSPGSGSQPQFSFSTDESGATFTCALDGGTASACTSPKSYNNLSAGKQTVTITSAFTVPSAGSATTLVGDTAVEGTSDSNPSDQAQAWPYTASASGTAGAISFYVDTGNTAPALRLGLYSDSNGSPGTLLDSGTVSSPHSGAWNTATLSGGVAITSGTKYWLAALGTGGGTFTFRDRAGGTGCTTLVSSQTNLAALSTSFSPGESWQGYCPGSFYINGTNTGAAVAPPAPSSTGAPVVSGDTVDGQTLSTSNGSWSNSPKSYAYQWQECNGSGGSCANIGAATSSSYTLASGDVGDTVRAVVTASNAGGSGSANSGVSSVVSADPPPSGGGSGASQVGGPTPAGVTCSQTLSAGADVGSALSGASPGAVVCLNPGSWSAITLSGITPSSPGVTLAGAPGQTVSVPGFVLSGDSNLTVEGFSVTQDGPSDNGFALSGNISDVTIEYNTIENQATGNGIYSYPGSGGETANGVFILYNQIDNVGTGVEVDGDATESLNWTISHNVIGPNINYLDEADGSTGGHYIQIGGVTGATIDNNAFEGPQYYGTADTKSHLNVLHCFSFGPTACTNLTFDNNILWHVQTRAQSILITDYDLTNIQLENNLDVEDPVCEPDTANCPASPWFIEKAHGITLLNNTSANAPWSINLGTCGDGCISDPSGYNAQDNIATGPPQQGQENYGSFVCTSSCTAQNNVSQDNSATSWGSGSGDVINWKPNWQTTSWTPNDGSPWNPPPQGYYQPVTGGGVTSSMGWQGSICTATIRTNCIGP